jgi:hypothetical protein
MTYMEIRKKSGGLEAGYVWAPYIPMMSTDPVYMPKEMSRKIAITQLFPEENLMGGLASRYSAVSLFNWYSTISMNYGTI